MFKKLLCICVLGLPLLSCQKDKEDTKDTASEEYYRFFDRELCFAQGVSVTPERSGAQNAIKDYLLELESSTLLGKGYFKFCTKDDSLLQPQATAQTGSGHWTSFIQVWDDNTFNSFVAENFNQVSDPDIIVSQNKDNEQEYFMALRLSCFLQGASCSGASSLQAKALLYRAYGYYLGLQYTEGSSSKVMESQIHPEQEDILEVKKFFAEFNNVLEDKFNNVKKVQ